MARIRTIKPEFFRHEDLFDAEIESGLPLRLAFISLWTVCDREGRFKWRPRSLKAECLPFDDCDFSRVLGALASRGFVVQYKVGNELYGYVPSFRSHQTINNKEADSILPEPNENNILPTRKPRVPDALPELLDLDQGEGKGKEGKGKEGDSSPDDTRAKRVELIQTVVGSWNELASEWKLPKVVDITEPRQRAIIARAEDLTKTYDFPDPIAGFGALFGKVRGSPFLRGEANAFRADLDFVTRASSFTRIMEGKYEGQGKSGAWPNRGRYG